MVGFSEHDNLNEVFGSFISERLKEDNPDLKEIHTNMLRECDKEGFSDIDIPFDSGNNISLSCSDIRNITSKELPVIISDKMFDGVYYKEFDCSFLECLMSGNLDVIMSHKANNFFKTWIYVFVLISLALIIPVYLLSESTSDFLKTMASCFVFVAVPFVFYDLINFIIFKISGRIFDPSTKMILDNLFNPVRTFAIVLIIFGLMIFLLGIYLKKRQKNG